MTITIYLSLDNPDDEWLIDTIREKIYSALKEFNIPFKIVVY